MKMTEWKAKSLNIRLEAEGWKLKSWFAKEMG